jgi:hypothetical protein
VLEFPKNQLEISWVRRKLSDGSSRFLILGVVSNASLGVVVREHTKHLFDELGFASVFPIETLDAGLADIELGLGQLLADVERAWRRNIPLSYAVHDHEAFPYLGRFHGLLHDAFVQDVPAELLPLMRQVVQTSTPGWAADLTDALCIVARSTNARSDERSLARLFVFEGLRVNLLMAAYRTNGGFEGLGGCRRDLDEVAAEQLAELLALPLAESDADLPFASLVASALSRLKLHIDALWSTQCLVEDLRTACEDRARLELALRQADPVDAAVLRNYFDRAHHQQPIPVARLPKEHPLILGEHNEASLNTRAHRALEKLQADEQALSRRPRPVTLAALIIEAEASNA